MIKQLRKDTGLGHELISDLLLVSRELVAKAENGQRGLKAKDLEDLLMLERNVPKDTDPSSLTFLADVLAKQEDKANKALLDEREERAYQVFVKERKLKKIKELYEKGLRLLQMARALKASNPPTPDNAHLLSWLNRIELIALSKIENHGLDKQKLLEREIRQLQTS